MPKIPTLSSKKVIFISFLSLISILILSILLNLIIGSLSKNCKLNKTCLIIEPHPSAPISYNSNCNLPPQGNSKTEIRNRMTALYACSVQSHLERYKDKKINLENGKSQDELIQQLFETDKIQTERLIYDSGNWQIYFWSPKSDQQFKPENYQVHSDILVDSYESVAGKELMNMNARQEAPSQEMVLAQPEVVIKVVDKYEPLNYKHILAMTEFETETQMLDLVLIHNKLLGQNQKVWKKYGDTNLDFAIKNSIPLLFLQDYDFNNKNDYGDLKFSCYNSYTANLKTEINLNKKEIIYFAHPSHKSLSKVKLWLEGGDLKYEVSNKLSCDSMIEC